jgi:hypothetical protein
MKSNGSLPPRGLLDQDYRDRIEQHPVPPDWRLKPNSKPKLHEWQRWRDDFVKEMSRMLWPIYKLDSAAAAAGRIAALPPRTHHHYPTQKPSISRAP